MHILGKYHARDIHRWEIEVDREVVVEECGFHPQAVCSCGNCSKNKDKDRKDTATDSEDSESEEKADNTKFSCKGKDYHTSNKLSCPLHALLYEIETHRLGGIAQELIHPVLGRGHSNLPESTFEVLTRFRSKNVNLHQLHYE